jgi:hypothetical protein
MLWRENINQDIVYELHLPDDDQQCLGKKGCSHWWQTEFCSLRCRISGELYDFLRRFPFFHRIMYEIVM